MKLAFASRVVYQFVLCTTKLGICSFYLRIFQDRHSKITVYALIGFILVSALAIEFTFIFSCKPVSGAWTLGEQNCLPVNPSFIANTVCNVVGDLALMIFVIPKIGKLQCNYHDGRDPWEKVANHSLSTAPNVPPPEDLAFIRRQSWASGYNRSHYTTSRTNQTQQER